MKRDFTETCCMQLKPLKANKYNCTSVFFPGKPMERRAWQATVHEVSKESDTT